MHSPITAQGFAFVITNQNQSIPEKGEVYRVSVQACTFWQLNKAPTLVGLASYDAGCMVEI